MDLKYQHESAPMEQLRYTIKDLDPNTSYSIKVCAVLSSCDQQSQRDSCTEINAKTSESAPYGISSMGLLPMMY